MSVPLLIVIVSIFVWIFPPLTNRKSRYFFFFAIMALSDPVRLLLLYTLKLNPVKLSATIVLLLLSSLVTKKNLRNILIGLSAVVTLLFVSINVPRNILLDSSCLVHFFIIYVIIDSFIRQFNENHSVNLFLILLITYEFIAILKYIAAILSYEEGAISFYLATFIQIFFGILFSFVNVNTKNFSIASER